MVRPVILVSKGYDYELYVIQKLMGMDFELKPACENIAGKEVLTTKRTLMVTSFR